MILEKKIGGRKFPDYDRLTVSCSGAVLSLSNTPTHNIGFMCLNPKCLKLNRKCLRQATSKRFINIHFPVKSS